MFCDCFAFGKMPILPFAVPEKTCGCFALSLGFFVRGTNCALPSSALGSGRARYHTSILNFLISQPPQTNVLRLFCLQQNAYSAVCGANSNQTTERDYYIPFDCWCQGFLCKILRCHFQHRLIGAENPATTRPFHRNGCRQIGCP